MVPGEALGGHLWRKGWPKGTILATMGGQRCHFGAPWWPKVTILATMGGQSGHFGAPRCVFLPRGSSREARNVFGKQQCGNGREK